MPHGRPLLDLPSTEETQSSPQLSLCSLWSIFQNPLALNYNSDKYADDGVMTELVN